MRGTRLDVSELLDVLKDVELYLDAIPYATLVPLIHGWQSSDISMSS